MVSVHSYTAGTCLKCTDANSPEKCKCCCNSEEETQYNRCTTPENQAEHSCYFCESDISFILKDKLVILKLNEFQHHLNAEPVQVSPDDLIKPLNTSFFKKYPELNYPLLSLITILRI
ncbi:MAG: hypothetical protein JW917_07295 [Ignavibacteria bacterium]|nr:hypothetical protein [Ignavibacteria bacterium]